MANVKQALEKKVHGMRSQTMSFANDGIEVSLSIPDTNDVKEAFGTVIETVVEQHEDIGKLNSDITKVSLEGKNSRKKIAEITTEKLKQILNYQLKLEEQLQAAQRQMRNFSYNIQGYVDEHDEETSVMGDTLQVFRNIEVLPSDISGETDDQQTSALFPTEEGAVPQDQISFQSERTVGSKTKTNKRTYDISVIDYHKVPPFTMPSNTKGRWRWAIRKTLQMIRRKKMKISFTRTRVDKTQTVSARLDALDREFCQLPEIIDCKIQSTVDTVVNNMNLHLQEIRDALAAQDLKTTEKAEAQDRRLEALEQIITSMQNQQDGKLKELEEKHNRFEEKVSKDLKDLSAAIKDMVSHNMDNLKSSLSLVHENLLNIEKQAQHLLNQIQQVAANRNQANEQTQLFNSLLQENSHIQDLQSQVGVVEGATNMIQSSLQNVSRSIVSIHDHYDRNLSVVSSNDLIDLRDLLKAASSYEKQIDGVRDSILSMKDFMNQHHSALQTAASDIVSHSMEALSEMPALKSQLEEVKTTQSDLKSAIAASDNEKRDLRSEVEDLLHKLEDLERVAHEHADALDQTRMLIETSTTAAIQQASKTMTVLPAPTEPNQSQQSQHPHSTASVQNSEDNVLLSSDGVRIVPSSEILSNSSSRPHSARPLSARPSSARVLSRPQSSKVNKFDDSPRDINVHQSIARRGVSANTMGSVTRDITSLKGQISALKDMMFKQLLKDKKDTCDPNFEGVDDQSNSNEESVFDSSAMFTLAFPEDKISEKLSSMLQELLPDYISEYLPEPSASQPCQLPVGIVAAPYSQQERVAPPLKHRATGTQRPTSAQDISQSINSAVQKVSSTGDTQPVKAREIVRTNSSSDSSNKRLIGSFVDYNASHSLLKTPSDANYMPSNFDSSPLIADIASIRSENLVLHRRLEEIEDEKLNESQAREVVESVLREQRKRDSKTDYRAMVDDMDVTVRELVKELLNTKRNHESTIAKLRQDFEAALGKAMHNSSIIDDSNADAVVSTKAICLACGRGSHVRTEACSRPISPSFLPHLSSHSIPGPDIYRGGFRLPVRSSSPPIGTGEISLLMRGRVESSRASKGEGSIEFAPSVASIQIPQTGKFVPNPTQTDDGSVDLKVGFQDDDFGLQSVSSNNIDVHHEMGLEKLGPSNSHELPRIHSAGGGVVRSAAQKNDNENLRPIFRKGFPAKKSLKAETTYAPERFDLTVGAYPVSKNAKQGGGKTMLSVSMNSLQ